VGRLLDEAPRGRREARIGEPAPRIGAGALGGQLRPQLLFPSLHLVAARDHGIPHPVTGRPILFVNPMHVHGFVGMKREAAWELIEELAAHATQERFVYYHSWQVGDLLIWDERATMHRGAGDYHPEERRVMLRTIVYPN